LVANPEGKRLIGRPKHKREDTIKLDLEEVEWGGVDWNYPAQDRNLWRDLGNPITEISGWEILE
jgi:hypothetical protein